ncbi:MAG: HNH endonuclease [Verrucomicrobiota bacterium]
MTEAIHTSSVLVLNRHWQAIDVKTPAQAFAMMATGSAHALDISESAVLPVSWENWLKLPVRDHDRSIGTARGPVRSPTVLVLSRFARMPRRRLTFSRRGLFQRDGGVCQYSGRALQFDEANIDHVIPRSRGGPTSWENCVLADKRVNHRKGDRTPEEAGLRLARPPQQPREMPAAALIRNHLGIRDWSMFLA